MAMAVAMAMAMAMAIVIVIVTLISDDSAVYIMTLPKLIKILRW